MPAQANNIQVEETIRSFGDLSMFYQAMINTGVISELQRRSSITRYLHRSMRRLSAIHPQAYPCFYAVRSSAVRKSHHFCVIHIVAGRHDLKDLKTYGQGIQTAGIGTSHF